MKTLSLAAAALCACALTTTAVLAVEHRESARHESEEARPDFAAMHAEFCKDHLARAAGRMAYLETRLSLTPAQQPLFATWRDAVLQGSQARAEACAHAGRPDEQPDLLTRRAREEERLKQRLAAMDAQTPALTALYQSLSPEQKRVLDHAGRRLHHRHDGFGRRGGDGDGATESDGHRF